MLENEGPQALTRRRILLGGGAAIPLAWLTGCGGGGLNATAGTLPPGGNGIETPDAASPTSPPVSSESPATEGTPSTNPSDTASAAPTQPAPGPAPVPDPNMPAWAMNVPLWTWTRIPNTKLSSVPPTVAKVGMSSPKSKINAWCGAGFSRARMAYIIAAAGGHGDYINNEVNAAIIGSSPHWEELRASSPEAVMRNAVAYEDGRRGAVHTYRTTQHIDRLDRTFLFNTHGPNYSALTNGTYTNQPLIMAYNHATGDWDSPTRWAPWPGSARSYFVNNLCCKHPVTEDVYCSAFYDGDNLRKFNPDQNTWSVVTEIPLRSSSAIDPVMNRMLAFGDYAKKGDPLIVDLSNGNVSSPVFGGLGADALRVGHNTGVVYDELDKSFLVFLDQSPVTVLRVRAADLYVEAVSIAGINPGPRVNGWQNSWQYVPSLKGVVCAHAYDEDMLYLRTSA